VIAALLLCLRLPYSYAGREHRAVCHYPPDMNLMAAIQPTRGCDLSGSARVFLTVVTSPLHSATVVLSLL